MQGGQWLEAVGLSKEEVLEDTFHKFNIQEANRGVWESTMEEDNMQQLWATKMDLYLVLDNPWKAVYKR